MTIMMPFELAPIPNQPFFYVIGQYAFMAMVLVGPIIGAAFIYFGLKLLRVLGRNARRYWLPEIWAWLDRDISIRFGKKR